MKIIVCIKQVPGTTEVEVDEKNGVLKRDGVESKMNPYDLYAIEQALLLKEKYGGTVDVISMGPSQAHAVLKEAIYMGADKAFLVSDRRFGGADVVATSYTLSQGIEKAGNYDLIICGKQTTDGDTAQVGPEMAEFMKIEHVANVLSVLEKREAGLLIIENQENSTRVLNVPLPCLLTIEKEANTPRLPSFRRKLERINDEITVFTLDDFADQNPAHYGLNGSATQVERIFSPEKNVDKQIIKGTAEKVTDTLFKILQEKKFL